MSEIVIDPILNNNCFRRLFRHKFRSYDSFYKVKIGNELMMDRIHLIFSISVTHWDYKPNSSETS